MKILCLQITRLGDILCTWPVLSALRRQYPQAEIHFVVREKFAEAAQGCPFVDHLWTLDSAHLLEPCFDGGEGLTEGLNRLNQWISDLRSQQFDRIINLSFSPSSSWIVNLIAQRSSEVRGYTRTRDLFLRMPCAASRYFKAQVGVKKNNRLHVVDLFAWTAGVELKDSDFNFRGMRLDERSWLRDGIVCHNGASQKIKMWPILFWADLLSRLSKWGHVTLVGGPADVASAEKLFQVHGEALGHVESKVGQLSLRDTAACISRARLFVGADSGPLHLAGLLQTPTVNLSVGPVKFWETGPLSQKCRVLVSNDPALLPVNLVEEACAELIEERGSGRFVESSAAALVRYQVPFSAEPRAAPWADSWSLTRWIYFDGEKPMLNGLVTRALEQLREASQLALQQLALFKKNPQRSDVLGILDRLDELIGVIGTTLPMVAPLCDYFRTEKESIEPGTLQDVLARTCGCYEKLLERIAQLESAAPANDTHAV